MASLHAQTVIVYLITLISIHTVISKLRAYYRGRRFSRQHGCLPPIKAPIRDPIMGIDNTLSNMRAIREHRSLKHFEDRFYSIGETYSTKLLFGVPIVITMDPENIKAILNTNFNDFALAPFREPALGHLLGDGIFVTDSEKWRSSRALLRPNFAREQVADLDMLEAHVQTLFKLLPQDGVTPIDLQENFFRFTLDTATEFLFGQCVHSQSRHLNKSQGTDSLEAQFENSMFIVQKEAANIIGLGPLARIARIKSQKHVDIVFRYVDRLVERALAFRKSYDEAGQENNVTGEKTKYFFLQELAKQTTDKIRMRHEVLNMLLAGRDTTASVLGNLFFMLGKNPDVLSKLSREVDGLNGELPSYSSLRDMPYLRACLRESLRLHPPVPASTRIATTDTFLPRGGGPDGKSPVYVAKGSCAGWSIWALHRRKDIYGPDADQFRPERWENLRVTWEYLPFNGGPRICLGQQYALTEISYLTVRLLQKFSKLEGLDPGEWQEQLGLTACNRLGCRMILTPRTS
ncbi:cytochrome P450 [Colletotrichum navitas]|uniref:Cytochrome P450 n=1 Tax=Colletotrichum navitas TaxID=681940 RepID=A0AAD8Q4G4_9PEZI|nr:cytochrome P450 [Colletotrichum navitas]KAK1594659.1 cytochrome P450 [Colletotrichum navitas]